MPHIARLLALFLSLSACSGSVRTSTAAPATAIDYPVAALPLSSPVRPPLVLDQQQLASPEAQRVCSADEIE